MKKYSVWAESRRLRKRVQMGTADAYEFEDSEVRLTAEGPISSPLSSLNGLDSVMLRASKDGASNKFDLPIIWDEAGKDNERKTK